MTQLLRFFLLSGKRWLKSASLCLILLLFPLLMLLLHSVSFGAENESAKVLLFCGEPDALTDAIFSDLLQSEGQIGFEIAASQDELENAVLRGEAACGCVFPAQFETLVREGQSDGSVLLLHTPSASAYLLARETVCAAVFHHTAPLIGETFFQENERFEGQLDDLLADYPSAYRERNTTENYSVILSVETLAGGKPAAESDTVGYSIPVRGIGSVLLFVMSLFGAAVYLQDVRSGLYRPMPRRLRLTSAPLFLASLLLPCALSVVLSLILCREISTTPLGILLEIAAMLTYVALLTAFGSLTAHLLRKPERVFTLLPLLSIAALIICPVFVSLSSFLPVLSWLEKLFPPFYYLASVSYQPAFLLITVLLTLLLYAADAIPNRAQNG